MTPAEALGFGWGLPTNYLAPVYDSGCQPQEPTPQACKVLALVLFGGRGSGL